MPADVVLPGGEPVPRRLGAARQEDSHHAERRADRCIAAKADDGEGDGLSERGDRAGAPRELFAEHIAEAWCQQHYEQQEPHEGRRHRTPRLLLLVGRWRRRRRRRGLGRGHHLRWADLTASLTLICPVTRPGTRVRSFFDVRYHQSPPVRWLALGRAEHILPAQRLTARPSSFLSIAEISHLP
jgi:hypothetical protein